ADAFRCHLGNLSRRGIQLSQRGGGDAAGGQSAPSADSRRGGAGRLARPRYAGSRAPGPADAAATAAARATVGDLRQRPRAGWAAVPDTGLSRQLAFASVPARSG